MACRIPRLRAFLGLLLAGAAAAQSTQRASLGPGALESDDLSQGPSLSADGRFVAFESLATNLVPGDTNGASDVFVRDLWLGTTTRVSVDSAGNEADGASVRAALSADGRFVAFESVATNLVAGDTNAKSDVFVHELATGITTRVSLDASGLEANADSHAPALSADGSRIAFESQARLVPSDLDSAVDVYVRDLASGQLLLASGGSGALPNGWGSLRPALSADGELVAFESDDPGLVPNDTNGARDVFVRDLSSGAIVRASVDSSGAQADGDSRMASISADGTHVAFGSSATNLVANDTNGANDVFVHDLATGTTLRASVDSAGGQAEGYPARNALSADGRLVLFQSTYPYLVFSDGNNAYDVFLHDGATGVTTRVSVDSAGGEADYDCVEGALSPDGRFLAFTSAATNLVANDANSTADVFLRDRELSGLDFCYGDGTQGACPCANSGAAGRGCANSWGSSGARLSLSGTTLPDTLVLAVAGELPNALSIALQGDVELSPATAFGDGLRCAGGQLKRLFVAHAANGALAFPQAGQLPISAQSAALGDPLGPGAQRCYQVYYRDPALGFCPAPQGNSWNVTNAVRVVW